MNELAMLHAVLMTRDGHYCILNDGTRLLVAVAEGQIVEMSNMKFNEMTHEQIMQIIKENITK